MHLDLRQLLFDVDEPIAHVYFFCVSAVISVVSVVSERPASEYDASEEAGNSTPGYYLLTTWSTTARNRAVRRLSFECARGGVRY